jgi:hypothetical protein
MVCLGNIRINTLHKGHNDDDDDDDDDDDTLQKKLLSRKIRWKMNL